MKCDPIWIFRSLGIIEFYNTYILEFLVGWSGLMILGYNNYHLISKVLSSRSIDKTYALTPLFVVEHPRKKTHPTLIP